MNYKIRAIQPEDLEQVFEQMWLLVKHAWPSELEREIEEQEPEEDSAH